MEDDRPPVQSDLLGVDDIAQQAKGVFGPRVARAPSQHPGQIVAGAERHYGASRRGALRVLADVVEALQDPAHRTVAPAHQNLVVLYVTEHVETDQQNTVKIIISIIIVSDNVGVNFLNKSEFYFN